MDQKYVKDKKLISPTDALSILSDIHAYEIRAKQPFDFTCIDFITQEISKRRPLLTEDNRKMVVNGSFAPKPRKRAILALVVTALKGLVDPNHKDLNSLVDVVKGFQEEYQDHAKGSETALLKLRAEVEELHSMKTSLDVHKKRLDQLYIEYETALKKVEAMGRNMEDVKTSVLETNKALEANAEVVAAFDGYESESDAEPMEPTQTITLTPEDIPIPDNKKSKKTKKKVEKYITEHRRMRSDLRSTRKEHGRRVKQLEKTLSVLLDKQSVTDEMVRQLQKKLHK